jgi:hypothetical protein
MFMFFMCDQNVGHLQSSGSGKNTSKIGDDRKPPVYDEMCYPDETWTRLRLFWAGVPD